MYMYLMSASHPVCCLRCPNDDHPRGYMDMLHEREDTLTTCDYSEPKDIHVHCLTTTHFQR